MKLFNFKGKKSEDNSDEIEDLDVEEKEEESIPDDGYVYEKQQKDYEEYKNISLDELEELYDGGDLKVKDEETELDDISEQVSKRGFNKRYEHLTDNERKHKEKQLEIRKRAKRQLMTGSLSLLFIFGAGAGIYYFFEEPINTMAISTYESTKSTLGNLLNDDVKNKFKSNFSGLFEKEEDVLAGSYNEPLPKKVNVDKYTKEEFTLNNGNYYVGEHVPEGTYVLSGSMSVYANDLDLVGQTVAENYADDIVYLTKGTAINVDGNMYPIQYKDSNILKNSDLQSGRKYAVGKDISPEKEIKFKGTGTLTIYDNKLRSDEKIEIRKPVILTFDNNTYISFTNGVVAE